MVSVARSARRSTARKHCARYGFPFKVDARLGENDRFSTGYIAPPRFSEIVAEFFAHPTRSVLGWEMAADAQRHIGAAVRSCIADRARGADMIVVSHGGVCTLLLCALIGEPIAQARKQPIAGGSCFFSFEAETLRVIHGWLDISLEILLAVDAPWGGGSS